VTKSLFMCLLLCVPVCLSVGILYFEYIDPLALSASNKHSVGQKTEPCLIVYTTYVQTTTTATAHPTTLEDVLTCNLKFVNAVLCSLRMWTLLKYVEQ